MKVTRFGDEITDSGPRNFPVLPTGGWFVISATHFQRVYLHLTGDWSPHYEQLYAQMRASLNLTPEQARNADQATLFRDAKDLEVLRFGRLAWSLHYRRPDAVIGGSLLAFRLTDAEVATALNGPPARGGVGRGIAHGAGGSIPCCWSSREPQPSRGSGSAGASSRSACGTTSGSLPRLRCCAA